MQTNGLGQVRIHDGRVKGVGLMGPWLDRWIEVDSQCWGDLLFQAEVKSSSAHATNGKTLSIKAEADELAIQKLAAWGNEWDDRGRCLKNPATGKVLVRMTPTEDFGQRRQVPLLIFGRRLLLILPGDHASGSRRPFVHRRTAGIWREGPRTDYVAPRAGMF